MTAQPNRLPPPFGLLVDRDRRVSFTFEGRRFEGFEGDCIASALAAGDQWVLSRSFKYHRPRGIMSLAGHDANSLVQLPGAPNVAADLAPISEGLAVRAQNVSGSLRFDRNAWIGAFARFLPVGFYYRAFYQPGGAWQRFWEPIFRRKAGLGEIDLKARPGDFDKAYAFCDVAVVGSGPAGLSAALAAASQGAEVCLIEQAPVLGGALTYARLDVQGHAAAEARRALLGELAAASGITVMTSALCNGWFADNYLPVLRGNRLVKLRAGEVILATGEIEQPAVFRNNDLPGVMLGSAAQRLIRLYGVRPGRRALVLASNPDGYGVALDLMDAGTEVAAIVDPRPRGDSSRLAAAVAAKGLKVLTSRVLLEARPGRGGRRVAGARLMDLAGAGAGRPAERFDCDLICVSVGALPAYHLALQAGAHLDAEDGAERLRIAGLPARVRLAGAAAGAFSLDEAITQGWGAGWAAAGGESAATAQPEVQVRDDRGGPEAAAACPLPAEPLGKDFVDFDEDLQVADLVNAVAEGYDEIELVKRFSTVGMGPSQGRHAALNAARIVARATGRDLAAVGVTTARPPVMPERLGLLAGRGFEPERLTPMHHRHLEAGAQMMTAGAWWRPAYYGAESERAAAIEAEVRAVREAAGLIDVSTLGGLEVRGPDAAEFVERLYTFGYRKQPVGRCRYLLMTSEAGSIADDGVACRFAEDHFYLTATTGGVDRVYRTMLWWNAQWRLEVDIANVTAAYAGVNLAGPRSRDLLAGLVEGIDLSPAAFPYLGLREGYVAGIPARVLRVGFVGELGYEIHVPASYGEALWDRLLAAGKDARPRPFGVEAQRVLRLEKGHIIVGQDSDAMTTPEEAQIAWAVARNKPFFVGQRSLALRARHPSKRRLVGFALPPDAPLPQESQLVVREGEAVGFVTSVVRSPTLGQIIGLAYTARDAAQPGAELTIRLTDGRLVAGQVVTLPFYDPKNQRQEG
ncbi:MAG: 2Fe-2S iron-sulfur cluster-binding protein [Kiloniellales bacterium]|nr:2Fe-2S iron-sulfur cluster-binding protein [Kiloniellales bacterium]